MGTGLLFWSEEKVQQLVMVVAHTTLYTLKGYILWYVNPKK